jgi:signal transduction histidine kinase
MPVTIRPTAGPADNATRVLVVDDDEVLAETIVDVLHFHGFTAVRAPTGTSALEMLRKMDAAPSVAIVDLHLPDMDGIELAAALHREKSELQVVMLTGHASVETAIRALRDGSCDYLVKPVEPDTLVRALRAAHDRHRLVRIEEQLRDAQRLDQIGRLAGGMAHDFNNLLTVIISESELALAEEKVPESVRDSLTQVKQAANAGADLTRQLLAFARRRPVEPVVLSPNEVVAGIETLLRRLIGERVCLTTVLEHDAGRARADRGQLEQVITNLVVNARDAMPSGGRVTITTRRDGEKVVLSVADTGTGIPASVRARLFEPFFTTKPRGKGTGLGLATCYGIITQFGGRIEVDSEEGKGSVFHVHLPLTEEARTPTPPRVDVAPAARPLSVVVVEDERSIRALAERILRGFGYTVYCAESGQRGLEVIDELAQPPDVVLVDVELPDWDGRDIARSIRRRFPGISTVLTSGAADAASEVGGRTFFLEKPFSAETLSAALQLAARSSEDDPAAAAERVAPLPLR